MDIDNIVTKLYERMQHEVTRILFEQAVRLGLEAGGYEGNISYKYYPNDPVKMATYFYKDIPLLTIQASPNLMGVEFVPHKIETIK
jgi:hypothetical protein